MPSNQRKFKGSFNFIVVVVTTTTIISSNQPKCGDDSELQTDWWAVNKDDQHFPATQFSQWLPIASFLKMTFNPLQGLPDLAKNVFRIQSYRYFNGQMLLGTRAEPATWATVNWSRETHGYPMSVWTTITISVSTLRAKGRSARLQLSTLKKPD